MLRSLSRALSSVYFPRVPGWDTLEHYVAAREHPFPEANPTSIDASVAAPTSSHLRDNGTRPGELCGNPRAPVVSVAGGLQRASRRASSGKRPTDPGRDHPVSYTHLRAHETPE